MVAKMTEAEYAAFKKKTGGREPQKVTTYYKENKVREEGLKRQADRRQLNRDLREKQMTTGQKVTRAVGKVHGFAESLSGVAGNVFNDIRGAAAGVDEHYHPRQSRSRSKRRGRSPASQREWGMDDFIPPGFGGFGMAPAQQPPRRKRRVQRRQPQPDQFDYLDYVNNHPFR